MVSNMECFLTSIFERFWWILGAKLGSKINQKSTKNQAKIDQKRRSTWEGILASNFHRFWWILGAKLGSQTEPRGAQEGT